MGKRTRKASEQDRTGVVATTAELCALRSEAKRFRVGTKGKVRTVLAGPFKSPFRGRGMEFEEVRAYQPGDDPRVIDWRVSARSGRVHSKLYSEERECPLIFFVDAGPTMRFGTRGAFKSVAAARAAACLAWAGFEAGGRVGGILRSPAGHVEIPPRGGQRRIFAFMAALARATSEDGDGQGLTLAQQISRLRRTTPTGSRVFIISDFYELDNDCRAQLAQLARRCELTCIVVYDVLEETPPPPGTYRVSDGQSTYAFNSNNDSWRAAYTEKLAQRRDAVRDLALKNGVHMVTLRTDQDPGSVLSRALGALPEKTRNIVSSGEIK